MTSESFPFQPSLRELISTPGTQLTVEQKQTLLRPEALAELSMDEYMKLWQEQLNPHFVAHVTRQGFRDHVFILNHTEGFGDYHTGLTSILQDDKMLRTPLAVRHFQAGDEAGFRAWLSKGPLQAATDLDARLALHDFLPFYRYAAALHFGVQEVADPIYGGETGNESFFVFPSDLIASQYPFACITDIKSLTSKEKVGSIYNDLFVWLPRETQAIPIDAGVTFLPKDTPVDPSTGSRYASKIEIIDGKEKRVLVKDPALTETFLQWAQSIDGNALTEAVYAEDRSTNQQTLLDQTKEALCKWCEPDTATGLIRGLAETIKYGDTEEKDLRAIAEKARADWKRPEQTIPAQEYWEEHFKRHPSQRPKHLVYYAGRPTQAVSDFLSSHGVTYTPHVADGPLLGFQSNHVWDIFSDPRAYNEDTEILRRLGHSIIDAHYKTNLHGIARALWAFLSRRRS